MNTLEIVLTLISLLLVVITFINLKLHLSKQQKDIDSLDRRFEKVMHKIGSHS
ncbi:MAG: hypothetical protein HYR78_08215 [Nitrospirae bacterium]|nr:hypothetical protein [Nitrospirota bacterium]